MFTMHWAEVQFSCRQHFFFALCLLFANSDLFSIHYHYIAKITATSIECIAPAGHTDGMTARRKKCGKPSTKWFHFPLFFNKKKNNNRTANGKLRFRRSDCAIYTFIWKISRRHPSRMHLSFSQSVCLCEPASPYITQNTYRITFPLSLARHFRIFALYVERAGARAVSCAFGNLQLRKRERQ